MVRTQILTTYEVFTIKIEKLYKTYSCYNIIFNYKKAKYVISTRLRNMDINYIILNRATSFVDIQLN